MASSALVKARKQVQSLRGTLKRRNKELNKAPTMLSYRYSGGALAGGAAIGIVRGAVGEEIAGAPVELVLGLPTAIAGAAMGQCDLIAAGTGMMIPFVADYAEEMVSGLGS